MEDANLVPALVRALDILEQLALTSDGIAYSALRERLSIPPASLTRILNLLLQRGYLTKADSGNYKLGLRLYAMGAIAAQHMSLLSIAAPTLNQLRDQTQETIELGVPDGVEIVIVAKVESTRSVRLAAQVGYRLSNLHASGLGKAMLAFVEPAVLQRYLARADWKGLTGTTITSAERLARELARIRQCGWGFDDGEVREDVRRFGAPVFDAAGKLTAVVALAGPKFRMPLDQKEHFGAAVKNAAAAISAALGYRALVSTGG